MMRRAPRNQLDTFQLSYQAQVKGKYFITPFWMHGKNTYVVYEASVSLSTVTGGFVCPQE